MPWGIIVLPGLEEGAPVSLSREAKAEALAVTAYMGTACSVYESDPALPAVKAKTVADRARARPLRKIDEAGVVDGVRVGREQQRLRVQNEPRPDNHLVVLNAHLEHSLAKSLQRRALESVGVDIHGVREIEIVERLLRGSGLGMF